MYYWVSDDESPGLILSNSVRQSRGSAHSDYHMTVFIVLLKQIEAKQRVMERNFILG